MQTLDFATIYLGRFSTLVIVLIGLIIGMVLNIVFGGFKVGKLTRHLEVLIPHEQFPAFLARINQRLAEIGFHAEGPVGPYTQGGQNIAVPTSQTHAKAAKILAFTADQTNPQAVKVAMSVTYKQTIVGDTGESAYADAVMKYVAGETDSLKPVANRSFMAFSSLVLSIWAWVIMFGMKAVGAEPIVPTLLSLTATSATTSILAIVTIMMKPTELKGMWLAVTGLVVSVAAGITTLVIAILQASAAAQS